MLTLLLSTSWQLPVSQSLQIVPRPKEVLRLQGQVVNVGNIPSQVKSTNAIKFAKNLKISAEGYKLTVVQGKARIESSTDSGARYGLQTLGQLKRQFGREIPPMEINDAPTFEYRGLHTDVSRHFFGTDVIKRTLDLMHQYKLNVFHWHLVDDGGWRLQLNSAPKLTELGAFRKGDGAWDYWKIFLTTEADKPNHGGFYSRAQAKEIVAYAAARGITVMPEIELPGHTLPAIHAYPELGCRNAAPINNAPWNSNVYCAGKEETFEFLAKVLNETMDIFPSNRIHIGGDEVDKTWWSKCPDCQARMQKENLKSLNELQSYFIRRIEKVINARGRIMVGWDEILEGGLAPNAVVMSWRGESGGIEAAKANHKVIMTPTSHSYFDYGYDSISTQRVFEWSVIPKELEGNQREMVLGGQANIWTEWIVDRDRLDRMTWPRMIAMAEVLWSGPGGKWPDFEKRLRSQCARLDEQGVAYYLEEPKIPAKLYFGNDPVVLNSADFEEPVLYSTDSNAPLGAWKPLKRVAIPKDQPVYFSYARKDAKGKIRAGDIAEVLHCTKWLDQNLEVSQQFEMSFYNGKFSKISEFENKPPDQRRWVAGINKASFIQPNNFGARYRAVVRLPGGLTKFHLSSDDGSIFKLNGVTVINHDGLHAGSTKSAGVMLKAGVYELEVLYFEAGGGSVLSLEMENENGIRKEVMLAGLS